ncbi:MAG: tetratricopeptide repeat protein [Gemmobacter sp.]|nr:tetratricopeptide repeat protein [Gemmobacter sp.]
MTKTRLSLALALGCALASGAPAPVMAEVSGPYLAARQAMRMTDYRAAAPYFTNALTEDPANTQLMEGLISALIGAGTLDPAVPVARRYLASGGRGQEALVVLLTDQLKRGNFDQALADIRSGPVASPLIDGLVIAWAELGAGRMAEALAEFDKLGAESGLEGFALYHKALALASAGDFESAEAIFADPTNAVGMTRRGAVAHAQILSQLERNVDALATLDDLFGTGISDPELDALREGLRGTSPVTFDVVRNPIDGLAEVFYSIAAALDGEAPDSQTLVYSRIAEHLRPDLPDAALLSASVLERLDQQDLALEAYARIAKTSSANLAAETGRAQALYALDRKEEAVGVLKSLTETQATYLSVHVALGDMLRSEERYAEAAEAYSSAIALIATPETRHWGLYYSRAITYERAQQWDKADADFRLALELNPEQPSVLNYLGYSMLDRNINLSEALGMVERAVAQRPQDGYIIDSLAWGYFLLGRFDDAVEPMERASLLMPLDPIVTDHLGDVYWAVGRVREAEFQWHRALSFEPEEKDATRIRRKLEVGLDAVLAEEGAKPLADRRNVAP